MTYTLRLTLVLLSFIIITYTWEGHLIYNHRLQSMVPLNHT